MRNKLLAIALVLLSMEIYAQVSFIGYVVDENDKKIKNVKVKLYEGNKLISTKDCSKKFEYRLGLEKSYTLELSKENYITKRVAISTYEGDKGAEPFMFMMGMDASRADVDENELDFPSTIIEYRKDRGEYHYNVEYTKNIQKEYNEILAK